MMKASRISLSRDQVMLLMAATNEFFLGVDIYMAHSISGTIVVREWIPIVFGPVAGVLLTAAGIVALRRRNLATVFANLVFGLSIVVGLLGAFWHIKRAILPDAPPGEQVSVDLLVWGPPVLAPLTFALVGLIGISAAWVEDPPDSGVLTLLKGRQIALPFSKTRAYCFMVGMGILATLISSVLDHARTGFQNLWLWIPTGAGVLGTLVALVFGTLRKPGKWDLVTYVATMVLLILVGVIGAGLHVLYDLTPGHVILAERFIRGAPFLAPLLFSNMGALGLITLLPSEEAPGGGASGGIFSGLGSTGG